MGLTRGTYPVSSRTLRCGAINWYRPRTSKRSKPDTHRGRAAGAWQLCKASNRIGGGKEIDTAQGFLLEQRQSVMRPSTCASPCYCLPISCKVIQLLPLNFDGRVHRGHLRLSGTHIRAQACACTQTTLSFWGARGRS